ncbi:enolase 4 isoform X2 [Mauremys reevesii]|uniref:enolase 4 isoform X2 n=1 Tax=Mauremys reevesii TaxID=260615 RepID=UPI00193FB652|nr:enolase 4 isoform X2 [Mauremys reevesii]
MEPGGERELRRRHLPELRHQAAEYYRSNEVPQRLEEALNATFYLRPPDLYGHLADAPTATTVVQTSATHHKNEDKGSLANYFSKFSKPPVICKLIGRKVLDGVGRPTLEVEIFCTVKNHEKSICSTVVSSHSEILENASPEAIDADENERNDSINRALEWVNGSLNEMLRDLQPADQCKADELLGEYFAKKVEEEKERKAIEKEEQEAAISAPAYVPALSAVTPSGKKKGVKLGKKSSVAEKPISPAEPIEPVLCGSIAIAGLSLAVAKTGATINNTPLYLHLALMKHDLDLPKELTMPLPMVTLLSCGKSSSGKLKLMKEVMLIPPAELTVKQGIERLLEIQKQMMRLLDPSSPQLTDSKKGSARSAVKKAPPSVLKRISHLGCLITGCDSLEQPLILLQTACRNLGLELGIDVHLAINCAAHELMDYTKGKYEILTGTLKSPDEMVDMYVDLINKYPSIIALIDPLRKEDGQQWSNICNAVGSRCYLIAEDAAKSISKLVEDQNINVPKCSGLIIKYTNQTKISDLTELTRLLDGQRHIAILGSPAGESSDDSLVDLAVGLGARFIKLGGLSRGERVTKYNRLLAIEEELAKNGTLRSGENHEFVDFAEEALTVEELLDALPTIEQDPWPSEHSQPLLAQDQNPVSLHGSTLHLNEATNLDPSILP